MRNLKVAGHSLGGALASLGALYIKRDIVGTYNPGTSVLLLTMGQPRTGDESFARQLDVHVIFIFVYANLVGGINHHIKLIIASKLYLILVLISI